jgi:hypothetical protein
MAKSSITRHQASCDVRFRGSAQDALYSRANSRRLAVAYAMGERVSDNSRQEAMAGRMAVDFITEVGSLHLKSAVSLDSAQGSDITRGLNTKFADLLER